jgi:molybdopterin biosynthesis enzyme MoaB
MRNGGPPALSVRILAAGKEGGLALPGLRTALLAAWASLGQLDVLSESVGDDPRRARSSLRRWCGSGKVDVVLTVGRAGHLPQDFVPEVTAGLLERRLPGIEERMVLASPSRPPDLLFRGAAGFCGGTIIVNLPARVGRAAAILRFLAPVLGHALGKAHGDGAECGRPGRRR